MCNVLCNCEDAQQFRYITCPAAKAYLCTFTDGPAYVRSDTRRPFLNKQLRSENSVLGDRESPICSLVFKCATLCGHVSPAHTTRVIRILIRGEVKHLPNDLTNSCHRKWAGLWEENSRHRMACRCGGPVDIPGDDGMPGEAKMWHESPLAIRCGQQMRFSRNRACNK